MYITDIPCRHYNADARTCTVYEKRFDRELRCLSAEEAQEKGLLPATCAYVRGIEGYVPAVFLRDHPDVATRMASAVEELREDYHSRIE